MLTRLWNRYVNADHFLIASVGIVIAHSLNLSFLIPAILALVGGFLHEWLDGDLFNTPSGFLDAPYEGIKDIIWFAVPLLLWPLLR